MKVLIFIKKTISSKFNFLSCITLSALLLTINVSSAHPLSNPESEKVFEYYSKFIPKDCHFCRDEAMVASRKELEKTFKELLKYIDNLNTDFSTENTTSIYTKKEEWKKKLIQSQVHWEKYRKIETEIFFTQANLEGLGGSGASNVAASKEMEKNYARVQELRKMYSNK